MNRNLDDFAEERMHILQMVEQGRISAHEAAQLLSSLQGTPPAASPPSEPAPGQPIDLEELPLPDQPAQPQTAAGKARWLRVRVTDLATGKRKVTVNMPFGLVNWGLKIGARYAPEVRDFDFEELSQMLESGAEGKLVDVMDEEDGEHVEVFVD
jgi:hypothetical protein